MIERRHARCTGRQRGSVSQSLVEELILGHVAAGLVNELPRRFEAAIAVALRCFVIRPALGRIFTGLFCPPGIAANARQADLHAIASLTDGAAMRIGVCLSSGGFVSDLDRYGPFDNRV